MPRAIHGDRAPLTFTFKNIGPVRGAELELGALTVIAGRNNTGKTYLVYTLYGFLKAWENWLEPVRAARNRASRRPPPARYPVFEQISEQVADKGQAELTVDRATLGRERIAAMNDLTRWFSAGRLAGVFSSPPEMFENASIGLRLGEELPGDAGAVEGPEVASPIRYDGMKLSVAESQPGNGRYAPVVLRRRLWRRYLRFLFPELPSEPFVLSAERFGISLFYRELDFTKSQLVDLLQKYGDRRRRDDDFPFDLLDEAVSRYARPIKDNIDYTRSLPDLRKQRSEIYDANFHNYIRKLMSGYYTVSGDGAIQFRSVSRGDRRFSIPLHLASSSARGLSDLYFFLRHVARKNHLLIVDEPESHLDTANQILLARLLARLARAGLRIIVTTHSDYIIKELNNLIMLSSDFVGKAGVIKRLGYGREDCIGPDSIRAYIAEETGVTRCAIDKLGMDMPNFDKTINEINEVADELSIRLAEKSDG